VKAALKKKYRRLKVWIMHVLEGYTMQEIAERLGVSRRTVQRDMAWLKEHPEEIPVPDEKSLAGWVQNKLVRLIEESPELTDWQKVKILAELTKVLSTRKVKKEEKINVEWLSFEDDKDQE